MYHEQTPRLRLLFALMGCIVVWFAFPKWLSAEENQPSGVSPQVISLPSGPGSLEGLGESFEPMLNTGTASYAVSLNIPPGRNGFQPKLGLSYNGGNANSEWGMGWVLRVPYIQRQTDQGLPAYNMTDSFIYSSAEELIPIGNNKYRFENETTFQQFRWLPDLNRWEVDIPNGTRYIFGSEPSTRLNVSVDRSEATFRWYLQKQIDVHGNEIHYHYATLGSDTYRYLSEVQYSFSNDNRFHALKFHYEQRPDPFTDRRSRASITTSYRASHIDIFALDQLVRRYKLSYAPQTIYQPHSLLTEVVVVGNDGVHTLPATKFEYTSFDPSTYEAVSMVNAPFVGLSNADTVLADMNYDGLPDIVYTPTQLEQYIYVNGGDGQWEPNALSGVGVRQLSSPDSKLADMDGNGQIDLLVQFGNNDVAYYAATPGQPWKPSDQVDYGSWTFPYFNLDNPQLRLMDVNYDKLIDIVQLDESFHQIWLAPNNGIWSAAPNFTIDVVQSGLPQDTGLIRYGDMTGDRLQDLIVVNADFISYFPHLGFGDYGSEQVLVGFPTWLSEQQMASLLFGDINSDGLADIVLPGSSHVHYWFNLGNGVLSQEVLIPSEGETATLFPEYILGETSVELADMDGDSLLELVYSRDGNFQYVDFQTGTQPNLLKTIDNGLGRTFEITYEPSTTFYVEDWASGDPWQTTVPFPVQVVSRVTVHDANSGDAYVIDYRYRDGYYDGLQKEFRGFAEVIMTQHGDETAASTVTHHIYDTGASEESRKGLLLEQTVLGVGGTCDNGGADCYRHDVHAPTTLVLHDQNGSSVRYSYIEQTDSYIYEQQTEPVHLRQTMTHDQYGNVTEQFNYGQVCEGDVTCGDDERLQYTEYAINTDKWLLRQPRRVWQTDESGDFVSEQHFYYDGESYVGLPLGQITHGNLSRQTGNLGPLENNRVVETLRQAFDSYGNVVGIMDANGNLTTVSYDSVVHTFPVVEQIHLEDSVLSYAAAYDFGFGQLTGATDFNGNALGYEYDVFGRIHKIALPGDTLGLPTQQFVYDLGSPRSSITTLDREQSGEAAVRTSVVYYDGLGRVLQTRREAEDGQVAVEQASVFNARQSIAQTFLPYYDEQLSYTPPDETLPRTQQQYDPLGRVIRTINPDDSVASVIHQPLQQVLFDEEDNRIGSPHYNTPKTLIHDGLERLIGVQEVNRVDGADETYQTTYTYNLLDNLIGYVDDAGNIKTQRFDGLARKLFMDDPDTGVTTYTYDDVGNPLSKTDAKGQTIRYAYDRANRPVTETWIAPDDSETVYTTYHYDADLSSRHPEARNTIGQLSYIEDQVGGAAFSYDARGNVIGQSRYFADQDLDFVTLMAYDATDRLTTLTYPDGRAVNYKYNPQGLLEQIPSFVDDINYLASGQLASRALTNGATTEYGYDNRLRVIQLQTSVGANVVQDLTYQFDAASNIVNISDGRTSITAANDQTHTYQYDALYRLTGATGAYGSISYAYSSIGNMIHKSSTANDARLSLGVMRYGENGAGPHVLTSHGSSTRQYDPNGNLIAKDGMTLTWDTRNQVAAIDEGTQQSNYLYGANGQRAVQTVTASGVTTTTLYISEYSELRGDEWVQYVFNVGKRVAEVTVPFADVTLQTSFEPLGSPTILTGETHFYIADHLGGTNLLLNETGQIESEIAYYPYGLQRYAMGADSVPYQYTGQELDATGLNYHGARYYDSLVGAFISADPLIVEDWSTRLSQPREHNLYAYVLSNPLNYTDPSGMNPFKVAWDFWSNPNSISNAYEGVKMATGESGSMSGSVGPAQVSISNGKDGLGATIVTGKRIKAEVKVNGKAVANAELNAQIGANAKLTPGLSSKGAKIGEISFSADAKATLDSMVGSVGITLGEWKSDVYQFFINTEIAGGGKIPVNSNGEPMPGGAPPGSDNYRALVEMGLQPPQSKN